MSEEKVSWSPWAVSADKKLSVRFGSTQRRYTAAQETQLCLEIRNETNQNIDVLAPWGDRFYAMSAGLKITRDNVAQKYTGPQKEYVLGTSSFCTIEPKASVSKCMGFGATHNALDLSTPGNYKVGLTYYSPAVTYQKMGGLFKFANPWEGTVELQAITFERSN